ncbi:hypothetical protein E2C01_071286 [Portunus trituberculatus]|uniref:Uncharacterized protein n=1 Tax=Portunus trituberculatus TaxID=210409 RepID=A0A5B7HZK5_PORTR|nr:hypothetical protein [Portunus trituberculatus]
MKKGNKKVKKRRDGHAVDGRKKLVWSGKRGSRRKKTRELGGGVGRGGGEKKSLGTVARPDGTSKP